MRASLLLIGLALIVAGGFTVSHAAINHAKDPRPSLWTTFDLYRNPSYLTPAGLRLRRIAYRFLWPVGALCIVLAIVLGLVASS
jgi:hypothetical protein